MVRPVALSNAAVPNQLSAAPARSVATPTERLAAPPLVRRPVQPLNQQFEPQRRRFPSLGAVIILGFLLVTAVRFLGALGGQAPSSQSEPSFGAPVVAGTSLEGGRVAFGIASDGRCGVVANAIAFPAGSDVWWTARLSRNLSSSQEVVVTILSYDGTVAQRSSGAPLAVAGSQVMCGIKPVAETLRGTYVLEIWDATQSTVLASGAYRLDP
jgi:hypothetical protein